MAPRIQIESPAPQANEPGFLPPRTRPPTHYFACPPSPEACARFAAAAVTGADVRRRSKTTHPGCALPWRVTRVVSVPAGKNGNRQAADVDQGVLGAKLIESGEMSAESRRGTCKPGKKRRVLLRERARARQQEVERKKADSATREKAKKGLEGSGKTTQRPAPPNNDQSDVRGGRDDKRARKNEARKARRKAIKEARKSVRNGLDTPGSSED